MIIFFYIFCILGCLFLIDVLIHWLRDELNPKKPAHRPAAPARPFIVPSRKISRDSRPNARPKFHSSAMRRRA